MSEDKGKEPIDLSWVSFLDEEPRDDPICNNVACTAIATWILHTIFPCGHYPDDQLICQRHKSVAEHFFSDSEEWTSPVRCKDCGEHVTLVSIDPNKLGE